MTAGWPAKSACVTRAIGIKANRPTSVDILLDAITRCDGLFGAVMVRADEQHCAKRRQPRHRHRGYDSARQIPARRFDRFCHIIS
jgi:hypothetical protein